MIRGKRNFLPPVQLIYGFGILWRIDTDTISGDVDLSLETTDDRHKSAVAEPKVDTVVEYTPSGDEPDTPAKKYNLRHLASPILKSTSWTNITLHLKKRIRPLRLSLPVNREGLCDQIDHLYKC